MENATKALEIAGGVLISILVIGMLVFGYTKLSELKQTEEDTTAVEQAANFNKSYETYNRDSVYGSELFSLANLMVNYNNKEADNKGYQKIELEANFKNVTNFTVFTATKYSASELTTKYETLTSKIKSANSKQGGKAISYWAGSSSELKTKFTSTTNPSYEKMVEYIKNYNTLTSEQEDVARKTFKCTKVDYDKNNGRITKMTYAEN